MLSRGHFYCLGLVNTSTFCCLGSAYKIFHNHQKKKKWEGEKKYDQIFLKLRHKWTFQSFRKGDIFGHMDNCVQSSDLIIFTHILALVHIFFVCNRPKSIFDQSWFQVALAMSSWCTDKRYQYNSQKYRLAVFWTSSLYLNYTTIHSCRNKLWDNLSDF